MARVECFSCSHLKRPNETGCEYICDANKKVNHSGCCDKKDPPFDLNRIAKGSKLGYIE